MEAVLLQACLNGARAREEHPALPCSPAELARDAAACVAAGAGSLHLHPRDGRGAESLAGPVMAATLEAIRRDAGAIEVGVSTGLWITAGDARARLAVVGEWTVLPDCASVNVGEDGWVELSAVLTAIGVAVEVGLGSAQDARAFAAARPFGAECVRVLVEPTEAEPAAAVATAEEIHAVLDAAAVRSPRLVHGEGRATWAVLDAALAAGHQVRVGLEDTLVGPDGVRAEGNAALVAELARRAAAERP